MSKLLDLQARMKFCKCFRDDASVAELKQLKEVYMKEQITVISAILNSNTEVSMSNPNSRIISSTPALELAFKQAKQAELNAWHTANGALLEEVVSDTVISFEDAENIRSEVYDAESMRRTKRKSCEVTVEEEVLSVSEAEYYEEEEMDDDFIYDEGGVEATIERQVKASIQTGNQDGITKRSSVYEDGGGSKLVRPTELSHLSINTNMFVAAGQEQAMVDAEQRLIYAYAKELKDRYDARRAKEIAMRDFALKAYEDITAKGELNADSYKVVRALLKETFGTEYIYQYCRYENNKGIKGIFDGVFHKCTYKKMMDLGARDTYLHVSSIVDQIPASSMAQRVYLITNKHRELGLDKKQVAIALNYAWNHKEVQGFDKPVYFALKALSA